MISDLGYLVLLHHFVGVRAAQTFALKVLYYICVDCVENQITEISPQSFEDLSALTSL
jgi:hypothetical protein